jgi:hypothetical protein
MMFRTNKTCRRLDSRSAAGAGASYRQPPRNKRSAKTTPTPTANTNRMSVISIHATILSACSGRPISKKYFTSFVTKTPVCCL